MYERCGNDLLNGFCSLCNSRNSCVYDPNPNSFDSPPDSYHPPHPTYETYSGDSCGNDSHFAWDRVFTIKVALGNKQYKLENIQELFRELFKDVQNIHEELTEYINTPGWNRPAFEDDDEDYAITFTPDFLITGSLSMGDKHLDTIPKKESDEFIKSSVENIVSNPSDDDESSHEEVIHEISFQTYSNPLFDLDEEIISSEFNPIHNEDLDFKPKNNRFDTKSYLLKSLLNRDESIPPGINSDDSDSEGDSLSLERLLHDDPIPLPDTLDFSYDVRVFLPFFTYPVISSVKPT
nr:hypothetical protein [Tanacetum cinerariifolium]GEW20423.1 hypothetical protein [Tanacetum cinerariifolium]